MINNIDNITLKKWLTQRCDNSCNVFDDPGYSKYYRSFFGIHDNGNIYKSNDIDFELNIDHNNLINDIYNDKISNIHNIQSVMILPGSNYSNANFLYKLLSECISEFKPFNIPNVSNDFTKSYKNNIKLTRMIIDKKDTYDFVYKHSFNHPNR